jgi:hypothetical protein
VTCGEQDPTTLELHHVSGQAYDDTLAIVCRNCHRKLSDPLENKAAPQEPPFLERVGRLLLGLADFLALLVTTLRQYGAELIARAQVTAWPNGWIGAPEVA